MPAAISCVALRALILRIPGSRAAGKRWEAEARIKHTSCNNNCRFSVIF